MPHSAAIQPAAKAPLEIQEVETPQPGPHEILIENGLIALAPIDAQLAKLAVFPLEYPTILGSVYGGTVSAVGGEVTGFKVGDKVAAARTGGEFGSTRGAFQKYVIARDVLASKLPDGADLLGPVGLLGNFSTVVGLFNARLGLDRPDPLDIPKASKGKKILVYGGTSSFGSFATQYLTQAGYDVVTTTSPKHKDLVAKLGAVHVVDHAQPQEAVVRDLVARGPYDHVVDSISLTPTFAITAAVVAAQGGGTLYALLPPLDPSVFPEGVVPEFGSWSSPLVQDEKNAELLRWAFWTYFPQAVSNNTLFALPSQKIDGGLSGLNEAVEVLFKGVSCSKVVVEL
ncbi:Enoyl reductase LovC [Colletotrichum tanaceti]|uniref:Enoyl reductase LovC n=1 Tax=Colletotrichum tanaceti TaxID=1306861 RepID=A0A4U6XAN8_9PEZI|nr:Enoyl reductase LovC [Colletotrichum tanaceti]TKW52741.1 Enoyl reductase LovC [Colletotrichum tanaceti]